MTAGTVGPTRREQRREQTLREIKDLAMEQIAAGGPEAVSLNGIARTMAMSPAAIYRYFDNRDALLADIVVEVYDSLADAVEAAGRHAEAAGTPATRGAPTRDVPTRDVPTPGAPARRLTAVATAFRAWALEHPNAYRLIFQTTSGSGQDLAPERTIPASSRTMTALLEALLPLVDTANDDGTDVISPALGEEILAWSGRIGRPDLPVRVLALGLMCWTRLHGVISLELGHHLASTGIDPALLYQAEIDTLIHCSVRPPSRTS
ncbi:TetR/AcrR family transcriptional regulator [Streptomyces sp. NPDC093109]|uniref:TetR/AcrR family transcriptional regulator n=1 Tax=Streptomyces sp. NPDC093109 TaxID=3154977 RepID=UPI00344DC9C8